MDEISDFENKIKLKLPDSYVLFLSEIQAESQSHRLHQKAPYYGFYALDDALKMNDEWEVSVNEPFTYTADFEFSDVIDFQEDEDFEARMQTDSHFADLVHRCANTSNLNGTLPICEYGCGDFFRLVVNGSQKGTIWADCGIINFTGYYALNVDVMTFYENWLDRQIHLKKHPADKAHFLNAEYPFLEFGNNLKYKLLK